MAKICAQSIRGASQLEPILSSSEDVSSSSSELLDTRPPPSLTSSSGDTLTRDGNNDGSNKDYNSYNDNHNTGLVVGEALPPPRISSVAPVFAHRDNFPANDLHEIRKLLVEERHSQNEEEHAFWRPDFERFMSDDWLVTRFLIRGRKFAEKSCLSNGRSKPSDRDDGAQTANLKAETYRKTLELIKLCATFRRDYAINANSSIDEFPFDWVKQDGIFTYRHDLAGNPVIYMRICLHKPKMIETMELRHLFKRLLLYHLEVCDRRLYNQAGKAICCIFDMTGATLENIDLELVSWMIKSFKQCSPKLLCYAIVYNLPWFFSTTFKLISRTLIPNSNKRSLKFVYGCDILDYIDQDDLPNYLKKAVKFRG